MKKYKSLMTLHKMYERFNIKITDSMECMIYDLGGELSSLAHIVAGDLIFSSPTVPNAVTPM